jgi:transposase
LEDRSFIWQAALLQKIDSVGEVEVRRKLERWYNQEAENRDTTEESVRRRTMSMRPHAIPPVPEETVRVARQLLPKGNRYLLLREELGTLYQDEQFQSLYPEMGQPAEAPWRVALVSVLQYMENYTDRQAAEAVRVRIDWKYLLGMELTDPGFDFSVLSEFRARLVEARQEETLLKSVLELCQERGWLKARGKQRTDSTHVLAAIRTINRLECVGETLRAALNSLAAVVPEWLRGWAPTEWYERYASRVEDYHLPKEVTKRQAMADQIGEDGWHLLAALSAAEAPAWLREVPAVEILRRVWVQQFTVTDGQVSWRSDDNIPPASLLISSPYDPEAHMSIKRSTVWTGYKVHLTETCDDDLPHLLVHVETTPATTQDIDMIPRIHQALAEKHLLPREHVVDTGYVEGDHLLSSQHEHQIELLGPIALASNWQMRADAGFDVTHFQIDWERHQVLCPQGKPSRKWHSAHDRGGNPVIRVAFGRQDCLACPSRANCTRSASRPRQLGLRPQVVHEATRFARQRQTTQEFKERYAIRAGIEGTLSQGLRAFDLRQARYLGLAKTRVQHLLIATAINLARLLDWIMQRPRTLTRASRFAALAS